MLPDGLNLTLTHCGAPLSARGGGASWEGELEVTSERFKCDRCGLSVEVSAREHVGPPGK